MSGSFTLSLRELVDTDLTKCTLLFQHEDRQCDFFKEKKLRWVNAAKLSLLLAQSLEKNNSGSFDDERFRSDSLKLSNFSVKLACSDSDDVTFDKTCQNDNPETEDDDAESLEYEMDPFNATVKTLDFLSEDDSSAEKKSVTPLETAEGSAEGEGEESLSICVDQDSYFGIEPICNRNPVPYDIVTFVEKASARNVHWILLGMEIRPCEDFSLPENSLPISQTQNLQNIGRMISEVFLPRCNQNLAELFKRILDSEQTSIGSESNNETDLEQRYSKLQRYKEQSLFSGLLESGEYPVSVCRLLSDMIDTSENGMADNPFASLEDVIDDLKQMAFHPQLHLDDPEDWFFSSTLRFGRGCYGRTEQVASVLKVASRLEGNNGTESPIPSECVEGIFISGIAGAGKSFLIQNVGDYLTHQGWIVLGAKFERGLEHESRRTVFSVFDKLVTTLVSMRDGTIKEDAECSRLVTNVLSKALDRESMSSLANFLPSIKELVDNVGENHVGADCGVDSDKGNSNWRLVFLLSSLLGAVLDVACNSDRSIIIYFDDLQWSDSTALALIFEIVISIGSLSHARERFLFVGMYRDNEVADSHPFTSQYDSLQRNKCVNVTSINLPSLTRKDVVDMMMTEMRLPRRILRELSDIIHKKTSGHALFVVQLLNSLVRDSLVIYSPTKNRYHWDCDQLCNLQTCDSAASLIVSNLSSLPSEALQHLRVLSCFGMKIHQSIIQCIGTSSDMQLGAMGIASSLPILIDAGIIKESSDSIIKFSHDLIRSAVYDGIAVDQRRQIHHRIGMFLGSKTVFGTSMQHDSIETGREHDHTQEEKQNDSAVLPLQLFSIATDHINEGSVLITDHSQRARFAGWNLHAAAESLKSSSFQGALHYCKNGIAFLAGKVWTEDTHELSCSLFQSAAFALLALGEPERVPQYANAIIENVPFERSFKAQYLLIRSLETSGCENEKTVFTAISVLRQLGFDIPYAPKLWLSYLVGGVRGTSPSMIVQRMRKTDIISSRYTINTLIDQWGGSVKTGDFKRDVLNICDSVILAGMRSRSPYLPLIVCETVNYSLEQDCVCAESALSFSYFGFLKIWLEGDYKEGHRWGTIALKILKKAKHSPFIRTRMVLYYLVLPWSRPLRETAQDFFEAYELGLKFGDMAGAYIVLGCYLTWSLIAGDKLSSLQAKYEIYIKQILKYNIETAKMAVVEQINIHLLMGVSYDSFSIFDGMICDENNLLVDALSKKNINLTLGIYWRRFFFDFWMGNDSEARKWANKALAHVKFQVVLSSIFLWMRGLISFRMYRQGKGANLFIEGKEAMIRVEKWLEHSEHTFKSKALLLQAEFFASTGEVKIAKETYEKCIRAARNHGRIHEQGLAHEMMGDYLTTILEIPGSTECYMNAHRCYMQWGAVAVAEKIQKDHHLDLSDVKHKNKMLKHGRVG